MNVGDHSLRGLCLPILGGHSLTLHEARQSLQGEARDEPQTRIHGLATDWAPQGAEEILGGISSAASK